jgi:hypothetical protein
MADIFNDVRRNERLADRKNHRKYWSAMLGSWLGQRKAWVAGSSPATGAEPVY